MTTPNASSTDAAPATPTPSWIDRAAPAAVPVLIVLVIGTSWLSSALGVGRQQLQIISTATADTATKSWNISGRVLLESDGRPVGARVWAIAADSAGNRYSPSDALTDNAGRYRLGPIPFRFAIDSLQQATDVTIRASAVSARDSALLGGEENLRLSRFGRVRWIEPPPFVLISVGLIFFLTIFVGLIRANTLSARRTKYFALVLLSFSLTVTMIGLIGAALRKVNANATQGDVISLGFANIYRGSYVKDVPPEWLFSLTSPQVWKSDLAASGFGVPLWLLLVAVLGSGIYTIALLVNHVTDPVALEDDTKYRKRVGEMVQHQFYLLFSPLGAVLVYQLAVAAGIASVPVTIALLVFAAGASVNRILSRAILSIQDLLRENEARAPKTPHKEQLTAGTS